MPLYYEVNCSGMVGSCIDMAVNGLYTHGARMTDGQISPETSAMPTAMFPGEQYIVPGTHPDDDIPVVSSHLIRRQSASQAPENVGGLCIWCVCGVVAVVHAPKAY